jgi:VanZ family protein
MIFVLCTIKLPPQDNNISIPYFDKIVHFIMYLTLSLSFIIEKFISAKEKIKNPVTTYLTVLAISFVVGGLIELVQAYLTSYRSGDIVDLICDVCGSLIAILIISSFRFIRSLKKKN